MPEPRQTTVALVDLKWVGHHPTYFLEFAESLRRVGARVLALCPEPAALKDREGVVAGRFRAPQTSLLSARLDHDPLSTAARWWQARRALDALEDGSGWRADLVFFPYLDAFIRLLPAQGVPDFLLGRRWSGLYFRNQHLGWAPNGSRTALRRWMKGDAALRGRLAHPRVGVLDERFGSQLSARTGRLPLPFPDITDEATAPGGTPLSRQLREQARGRTVVGLLGLEKRKGVLTFLQTALALKPTGRFFFVAAGLFPRETYAAEDLAWMRQAVRELGDAVHFDWSDSRLPDGVPFNSLFSVFDVAWAAYEGFQGSSNTLTKAAVLEKPVLASAGECVGQRVEEFRLGVTIPEGDFRAAAVALPFLARGEDLAGRPLNSDFRAYRSRHSRARLDACFRELITTLPATG